MACFALVRATVSGTSAARVESGSAEYKRREPQASVLRKLVRDNLESFLAYTREHYRKPLPKYVERELRGCCVAVIPGRASPEFDAHGVVMNSS